MHPWINTVLNNRGTSQENKPDMVQQFSTCTMRKARVVESISGKGMLQVTAFLYIRNAPSGLALRNVKTDRRWVKISKQNGFQFRSVYFYSAPSFDVLQTIVPTRFHSTRSQWSSCHTSKQASVAQCEWERCFSSRGPGRMSVSGLRDSFLQI